jgi:ketosteroid isomerase-like protein
MTAFAGAQTWSDEQLEVWQTIKSEWEMSKSKDSDRLNRLLHEKFLGWGNADPAPRNRASVVMWDRFNNETNSTLVYELYPLGIVVHKDTAVAHYLYSMAVEDQEGERETESGRYTDILVKDGGQWKFLAWSGGITDSEDD